MGTMTYTPIATTTLSSAASSITFSSIASTYTDLRLVLVGTTTTPNILLRFNSDSGTNYSGTFLYGNGSSATSANQTSVAQINLAYVGTSSSIPTMAQVDIFSYAGSTYKTVLNNYSSDQNGAGNEMVHVGLWRSTSAISSILLTGTSGTYSTGFTATLYGIKNA